MIVQKWTDVLVLSLQDLYRQVLNFLPSLIGAIIVFVVGLVIAAGLGAIVERVVGALKIDTLLRRVGLEEYTKRANIELNFGHFLGQVVYWFIVLAFLLAAAEILNFYNLSGFIQDFLFYVPNIIIAVLIMIASFVIANILKHIVRASVMGARLHSAKFLGAAVWWIVVIFGLLASLVQLRIAVSIIETVITGLIAMLALAGGLAFGLGGKEYASEVIGRVKNELEGR
ncbi:MAG TPA: hypothetical protein VJH70_01510 [Candidatus Paceibacterota bacterium]